MVTPQLVESRFRRGWPVRARLLLALLLVTALGMGAAGATTFLLQRQRVLASIDTSLLARVGEAQSVVLGASNSRSPSAPRATPKPFGNARTAVEAVVSRVLPDSGETTLGIVDGKPTFVPGVTTSFQVQGIPGFLPQVISQTSKGQNYLGTVTRGRSSYRYVAAPIRVEGSSDSAIFVSAVDINSKLADLTDAFATYWEMVGIAFLLVAGLGWFISGRLLRPLTELRMTAARITSDNHSERIPTRGNDDLALLGVTVNSMLDRLDSAMTTQRHLLDDVRHELNTPIAIVQGHLELVDVTNAREVESARSVALEELDRISTIVQDLSLLAESEQLEPRRVVVELGEFTREFFAKVSVLEGHYWVPGTDAAGSAAFDPEKITQAWLQLVDNAAKYSPAGSEIALGTSGDSEQVEFWVINSGPKIPEDARARIFERFGRIDANRGIRGSGLGLAIVSAIALAHRGSVTLSSSNEQTRFGIRIPRIAGSTEGLRIGERQ
jgi:two-component system, OmpR family, sensor kinase